MGFYRWSQIKDGRRNKRITLLGLGMRIMKENEGWRERSEVWIANGTKVQSIPNFFYFILKKKRRFSFLRVRGMQSRVYESTTFQMFMKTYWSCMCTISQFAYSLYRLCFANMLTFMRKWKRTQKLYLRGRGLHMDET